MSEALLPIGPCDRLLGAIGGLSLTHSEAEAASGRIAGLSMEDLIAAWRVTQRTRLSAQTPAIRLFNSYFDGLGVDDPGRALDFVAALDRQETDEGMFLQIGHGKILGQLVHARLDTSIDRLVVLAAASPRLRIALASAGALHAKLDDAQRARLAPCVDQQGWSALYRAREAATPEEDFASYALPDLARAWLDIADRSPLERDADDTWHRLVNAAWELPREDPERSLALIVEILKLDVPPALFGLLAAGMLEDLVPAEDGPIVDAIVAEAERNPRLRELLGGVWYYRIDSRVVERLKAVTAGTW